MLDYDMLASTNFARLIYDGDGDEHGFAGPNGSGVVEQVYKDWYDSQGLSYQTIPFDGRSDYDAFSDRRDPGWWQFLAGAEELKDGRAGHAVRGPSSARPLDPCYHQAMRHAGQHQPGVALDAAQGRRGPRRSARSPRRRRR